MNTIVKPADLDTRQPVSTALALADAPAERPAEPSATPPASSDAAGAKPRFGLGRLLRTAAAIGAFGAAAFFGWQYWTVWRVQQSTDDAYVQADVVFIAPKVAGYLHTVNVEDNQPVKAGDVLATIDPRDYQAAVDQATADVAEASATIDSDKAQLQEQLAVIQEAQATITSDQAAATFADLNDKRFGTLARDGFGTLENAQQAASQTAQATAQIARDKAALLAAEKQVDTLDAAIEQAKATLAHNRAVLDQAKLNLGYTVLRAPVDGVIGARTLRVGQYVQPGTDLLAVVPLQSTYIVANYKETQLAGVKPGQPVGIAIDTFPGVSVRGTVDSLAPASGEEFALLPPDNATGNFTKIVQRIPVKITIDRTDPLAGQLRPGMSVTTTIEVGGSPSTAAAPHNG